MTKVSIDQAYTVIASGGIIALPTDTVYGVGASIHSAEGIEAIYHLKNRCKSKPLIALIADFSDLYNLVGDLPSSVVATLEKFWPGALTTIFPIASGLVPEIALAGGDCCGFRIPDHELTRELLRKTGPILAPSANPSSMDPALTADEVEEYFGADFPVLDGGRCKGAVPSTIIKYHNESWELLREGTISAEDINA